MNENLSTLMQVKEWDIKIKNNEIILLKEFTDYEDVTPQEQSSKASK